jgi:hypothetical protein
MAHPPLRQNLSNLFPLLRKRRATTMSDESEERHSLLRCDLPQRRHAES